MLLLFGKGENLGTLPIRGARRLFTKTWGDLSEATCSIRDRGGLV